MEKLLIFPYILSFPRFGVTYSHRPNLGTNHYNIPNHNVWRPILYPTSYRDPYFPSPSEISDSLKYSTPTEEIEHQDFQVPQYSIVLEPPEQVQNNQTKGLNNGTDATLTEGQVPNDGNPPPGEGFEEGGEFGEEQGGIDAPPPNPPPPLVPFGFSNMVLVMLPEFKTKVLNTPDWLESSVKLSFAMTGKKI